MDYRKLSISNATINLLLFHISIYKEALYDIGRRF